MSAARQRQQVDGGRCWGGEEGGDASCFTVVLSTFKRPKSAFAAANYYRSCGRVSEVRLVWVEARTPPSFRAGYGAPVYIDVHYPAASLNTRFKMLRNLTTDAVFSIDDDVRVSCRDLHGAHDAWRGQPKRIVGFFPRTLQKAGRGWRYRAYPAVALWKQYHIVLTKAAFLPASLLRAYSSDEDQAVVKSRQLVEDNTNCEDVAMQFVAAHYMKEPPLFYTPTDEVVDYGSWLFGLWMSGLSSRRASGQHMIDRSRCVTNLSVIWGNTTHPLPSAHEVVGGSSMWLPANGWELLSSDLWAPLVKSGPPLLCLTITALCLVLLFQINFKQSVVSPSSPSLLFLKAGRCVVVAVLVSILIFMLDCCHSTPEVLSHAAIPPCKAALNTSALHVAKEVVISKRKLRIAVTTGVYSGVVDGVALTINRMVRFLLHQGHEVLVFTPDRPTESGIPNFAGRVVQVNGVSGYVLGKGDYYYASGLGQEGQRELERFKPDVIHSATPDSAAAEAIAWGASRGIPSVCSYHTRFNTYFRYYGFTFLESLYWFSVRPFFNRCTRVLPPTEAVKDELRDNGITSGINLWARGVDIDVFHPLKRCADWRGVADSEVVVLFASRLVLEKNLKVYVDVIKALQAAGVVFSNVIVGDGAARGWLQKELPDSRFLGRASEEELSYAFASSDVFFFPSTTETWGNVVLEAMSSGLPVVGSNASGTSNLVRHGTTGYLCDPSKTEDYVHHLKALIASASLRARLSLAARSAAKNYTWERAFATLLSTYEEVLDIKQHPEKEGINIRDGW